MSKILSSLFLAASVTLVAGCGADRASCGEKSCATKSGCGAETKAAGSSSTKCPAPAAAPAPAAK